jgi:hypothetical protein
MATTANYSWSTPDDSALVKDGASAIRALGTAIDTSMNTALGTKKAGMVLLNTTSFSAVSSQSFNTVFNSTYRNYRIVASIKLSADTDMNFRIRSGTTDLSSAGAYYFGYYYVGSTSSAAAASGNNQNQNYLYAGAYGSWNGTLVMDITAPFATDVTNMSVQGSGRFYLGLAGSLNNNTTSYDGFTLYPNSGTMTGVVSIYGYNA